MAHFLRGCLLLGLVVVAPVLAEGPRTETAPAATVGAEQTPEDCLRESLQALLDGDYRTYVQSLTMEEQVRQAGLVRYTLLQSSNTRNIPETGNPEDVETWLMVAALNDLVQKHCIENMGMGGYDSLAYDSPTIVKNAAGEPGSGVEFANQLVKLGCQLTTPGQFLIEALEEIRQPIRVSGAVQETRESSVPTVWQTTLQEVARHYRDAPWTFYTRGSRAVAVLNQEALPATSEEKAAIPGKGSRPHPPIELVKIDGTWKIARLLYPERFR